MLDNQEQDIEVKVQILQLIKKTAMPLRHRLDDLLKDHYAAQYSHEQIELTRLLEYASATYILISYLEKYIEKAQNKDSVFIQFDDFAVITHTSKMVESAYRSRVSFTPLWTH